jgi:hypothetical protein
MFVDPAQIPVPVPSPMNGSAHRCRATEREGTVDGRIPRPGVPLSAFLRARGMYRRDGERPV